MSVPHSNEFTHSFKFKHMLAVELLKDDSLVKFGSHHQVEKLVKNKEYNNSTGSVDLKDKEQTLN